MLPHSVTIPDSFAEPRVEEDLDVSSGDLKHALPIVPGDPSAGMIPTALEPEKKAYQLSATD